MTKSTIASLEAQLAQANARIEELEAQPRDHLSQLLWLSDKFTAGRTKEQQPVIQTTGQYASVDKSTGVRSFGATKFLVAYGEIAEQLSELYQTGNRLVAITAYERPWRSYGQQGGLRKSDWVITSVEVVGPTRPLEPGQPAEQELTAPFSSEPTAEPIAV